jgi:hypothetical protein
MQQQAMPAQPDQPAANAVPSRSQAQHIQAIVQGSAADGTAALMQMVQQAAQEQQQQW